MHLVPYPSLPENGTYVVRVNATNLQHTGSYNLGLECRHPQPLPVVNGTLACGELLSDSIDAPGDVDLITFTGTAGDVVDLTLVQTAGFSPNVARANLYSPTNVFQGTISANSLTGFNLPETGTYVIQLTASNVVAMGIHVLVFFSKVLAMIFLQQLLRWSLPRFRYDQVMNLGWKIMLPLSIANIVVTGLVVLVLEEIVS